MLKKIVAGVTVSALCGVVNVWLVYSQTGRWHSRRLTNISRGVAASLLVIPGTAIFLRCDNKDLDGPENCGSRRQFFHFAFFAYSSAVLWSLVGQICGFILKDYLRKAREYPPGLIRRAEGLRVANTS